PRAARWTCRARRCSWRTTRPPSRPTSEPRSGSSSRSTRRRWSRTSPSRSSTTTGSVPSRLSGARSCSSSTRRGSMSSWHSVCEPRPSWRSCSRRLPRLPRRRAFPRPQRSPSWCPRRRS
ncbi:unnamed protein product, partial [Ixodes pacificus]